jgi:hypothetical protein
MNRTWKIVLISSASALFIFLIIYFLVVCTPDPPVTDMAYARNALALASRNKADAYSDKLFKEAKGYYESALSNWKKENDRFIYFRDYSKVSKLARQAVIAANRAADSSRVTSASLKQNLKQKIDGLEKIEANIDDMFTSYPLSSETRNRIAKGKMLLKEAEIIYAKGRFQDAEKKLTESEYLLTTSYEAASENLKNYFRSYPAWRKWVEKTIADSKESGEYSIIVDKFNRKLIVYLNGSKKFEYSAELGRNWVGDKLVRGDKATPEGMYRISGKFNSDKTKYYKALLLDYPNDEDTARFKEAMAKGLLPKSAKIGGMIEIHGNGGKGIDWTEGCIALTDQEMDSVFRIAKIGTPVTIVGSLQDLKHVLNR